MAADEDLGFRVVAMESFAVDEDIPPIRDRTSTELDDRAFAVDSLFSGFLVVRFFCVLAAGFGILVWVLTIGFGVGGGWLDGVGCHSNRIFLRLSDPGWVVSLLGCGEH